MEINTQLFGQYAEIKRQIKQLTDVADILNERIVEELRTLPKPNQRFDYGTFTLKAKKSYVYSEEIQKKDEDLKIEKMQAVEKGEAHVNESHYLEFKPIKE